jgi:addiction module HigA family antidote
MKVRTRVIHPGKILLNMLEKAGISQHALAKRLGLSGTQINYVCQGKQGISPLIALMLARFFKTTPELWLNMQNAWNLSYYYKKIEKQLVRIKPLDKRLGRKGNDSKTRAKNKR